MMTMRALIAITLGTLCGACSISHLGAEAPHLKAARAARYRADLHIELALAYLDQGQPAAARREAGYALKLAPAHRDALHVLALADLAAGERSAARLHFQQALEAAGAAGGAADAALFLNYGNFLCDEGEFDAGRALLSRIPESARAGGKFQVEHLSNTCKNKAALNAE